MTLIMILKKMKMKRMALLMYHVSRKFKVHLIVTKLKVDIFLQLLLVSETPPIQKQNSQRKNRKNEIKVVQKQI